MAQRMCKHQVFVNFHSQFCIETIFDDAKLRVKIYKNFASKMGSYRTFYKTGILLNEFVNRFSKIGNKHFGKYYIFENLKNI